MNHERSTTTANGMTENTKTRITKSEGKESKRVIKILKEEARAEDKLLTSKVKELGRHQKVHKQAAKDEASALSLHSKAIKTEHKLNMRFLAARAKHESALADLNAKETVLAGTKEHTQQQTQVLKGKQSEVEGIREKKAVDDRERVAKLKQLTTNPTTGTSI